MNTRRNLLKQSATVASLLAAGLLPAAARAQASGVYPADAFDAKSIAAALKALGVSAPVESKEVALQAPDIAENGAVVPLGASTALPGVKRLLLMVEKNPAVLSAMFEFTDAVEPAFATRVKMNQSSNVYAVAMLHDGRVLFAQKEVKVTLGGCGT